MHIKTLSISDIVSLIEWRIVELFDKMLRRITVRSGWKMRFFSALPEASCQKVHAGHVPKESMCKQVIVVYTYTH